jgi:hypothetical protein
MPVLALVGIEHRRTTTMRNDALPSHLLQTFLFYQAYDGMECAAYFERAYALEVFALEV